MLTLKMKDNITAHAIPCHQTSDLIEKVLVGFSRDFKSLRKNFARPTESLCQFCRGTSRLTHQKVFQPLRKINSGNILRRDYLVKPKNATSSTGGADGVTSAVQDRQSSHSSAHLSVFHVEDTRATSKETRRVNGNDKVESQVDWFRVGDELLYRERFVIRCYEVGTNSRASIETMANLLQEVACNQVRSLGFSTDGFATTPSMRELHLIWVTTRMHIEVDEYPAWGDVVEIDTWFQGEGKVGTRRDWLIRKVLGGEIIGRATSTWVMMNQDTRRLSRITDDVRAEYMAYSIQPPRWAFSPGHIDSTKKILKLKENAQHIKTGLKPRRGDLDMNQHVNNVTYIGWMLESLPAKILNTQELSSVTLEFRRECKHDDTLESISSPESLHLENYSADSSISNATSPSCAYPCASKTANNLQFLHLLRLSDADIEINRGRTEWRAKAGSCTSLQNK